MSRAGTLMCAVLVLGGALLMISMISPGTFDSVSANGSESTAGSVVITSDASPEQATWLRLRWMLAGAGISAVLLISIRQLQVFTDYRPASGRSQLATHRRNWRTTTPAPAPIQNMPGYPTGWAGDPAASLAGD